MKEQNLKLWQYESAAIALGNMGELLLVQNFVRNFGHAAIFYYENGEKFLSAGNGEENCCRVYRKNVWCDGPKPKGPIRMVTFIWK